MTWDINDMMTLFLCYSEVAYDQALLARYRKALDTAVKIATVHNVTPIKGTTLIYVNLDSRSMNRPCTSARGLGKPRQVGAKLTSWENNSIVLFS